MSDFAWESISLSEYEASESQRVIDLPVAPSDTEIYLAMIMLKREIRGHQAVKLPAKILKTDKKPSGLYVARLSLHDKDMHEYCTIGASFNDGYWIDVGRRGLSFQKVPAINAYLKNGRTEVDDTLDAIFEHADAEELAVVA